MRFVFILLIIMVSISACVDFARPEPKPEPEPTLPPITQEGKKTFGFLLNGEVWLPRTENTFSPRQNADYYMGRLNLYARKQYENDSIFQSIVFQFIDSSLHKPGIYYLNENNTPGAQFFDWFKGCEYLSKSNSHSKLEILKLDTANRIIAGTFDLTLTAPNCDTLYITEGRFDLKY